MIRLFVNGAALALVTTAVSQAADLKDAAVKAAKALGEKPNYSWTQTVEGSQFGGGTTQGKTEKDGLTHVTSPGRDGATIQRVIKGEKIAVDRGEGWQSLDELAQAGGGGGGFFARFFRNFRNPHVEAADLASQTKGLKEADGYITGDLTDEALRERLSFGGQAEISGAKGSVKIWIKDGVLSKYQYHLQGKVTFGDRDFERDNTYTIEIKDVGSTKVSVPEEAKKKVS